MGNRLKRQGDPESGIPDSGLRRLRLGFACVWGSDPQRTWSYTPWDLREALRRRTDVEVVDIGIQVPLVARRILQLASLRRRSQRWVTPWEHLRAWEIGLEAYLDHRATALHCDAVLQIQDLGVLSTPYFVYQDLSYDVVLGLLERGSDGLRRYFPHLDRESVLRRRARQLRVYGHAAGMLAMSEFLRMSLIERTGLEPAKVHTVYPGAVASAPTKVPCSVTAPMPQRTAPRRRLLFVGTTFEVKAGDTVVAAFQELRRRDPSIMLTVAGPAQWPVPGDVPEGVDFVGRVDPAAVPALYDAHDLLVMPSRMEGFGKVFVEALARGLPCIGRDDFAMPELVRPGENGGLVTSDDPIELADCIASVLVDEGVYQRCAAESGTVLSQFNWDRAAAQVVATINAGLHAYQNQAAPAHLA
jgi:glycosyltransferase involved in cell wall biosynthesis